MSKFLYPIYKLKTKSYIKWWLYHKKAGGSGVLSEILEGFSFNLENTLNRKFKLFEIEGNSVQDGSPSPDNEVPILSSGDNGSINEKIKNADGTEEQDYSIFVQQPMRSIGDVRDCFVKKDGNWYERHFIGEVVLNGSENWGLAERSETSNGVFYIENFLNTYGLIRERCLSNYGTYVTGYSNRVGQFDIHYSQLRFYAYNNTATINDWKNKLTEKNLVINGFLAEPLDLPCTEIQIQQLENKPSTYKDFTIIQSQDETPAYLKIQYYKEG